MRALLLSLLLSLVVAPAAAQAADVDLVVRREPGLSAAARADVRSDAGVEHKRMLRLDDTEVVTVPAEEADEALRALRADPDVRWVQRDGMAHAAAAAGKDPFWSDLWGLHNTGQTGGTADADVDAPEAWAVSTGAGVTVAVVDTGVDAGHADLAGRLATNPREIAGNGVDDDGNGLVDDWRGWDFAYGDNNPSDEQGHGTHVSGTIAAVNGNAKGISGLAPDAKVLNVKGLDDSGSASWSTIADAFDYAAQMARIVNASLGGEGEAKVIEDVIAAHLDTLFVVAAGNEAYDLDTVTYSPCEVPQPNVLCVGASDHKDLRASFSNYSPSAVDVFAPGVSIKSTTGGGYGSWNGTSMATPHVAAIAALLLARNKTLTAAQLKQTILAGAEQKTALKPYGLNGGRANAYASVSRISPPADRDRDGVPDVWDNCPAVANPGQADADGDGTGDACDARPGHDDRDGDGDGVPNGSDNCAGVGNPDQADTDGDGVGDACDATPRGGDADGDGWADLDDNCPAVYNEEQYDSDADGVGDDCDPTPWGDDEVLEAPTLSRLSVKVAGAARCRGSRACTRTLRVSARTTEAGSARVSIARQRCSRRRCAWKATKSSTARIAGDALKTSLRAKLAAGRYRVTVTVIGPGGKAEATRTIKVR